MNTTHISTAVNTIKGFKGPAAGDLMVQLQGNKGIVLFFGTPEEAIDHIRANPRIEFTPVEKWLL